MTEPQPRRRIVALTAENIKRLVAVHIEPRGNVVQITGKNGQGKTSVLDSIWWLLAGKDSIQRSPIRRGQQKAFIKADLGDIVVTRKFTATEDGGYTTALSVESAEGARFSSPQQLLDQLIGPISFDPLIFPEAKPEKQIEMLRQVVPGLDFRQLDADNETDYAKRTKVNAEVKRLKALEASIVIPKGTPSERIDTKAILDEMEAASESNRLLEVRKANRAALVKKIADSRSAAKARDEEVIRIQDQIKELQDKCSRLQLESDNYSLNAQADQKRLDAAGELPPPIAVADIRMRLTVAEDMNKNVAEVERREKLRQQIEAEEAAAEALTLAMEARDKQKQDAIAAADIPVPGLSVTMKGEIIFNGEPIEQASGAQQMEIGVRLVAAANPTLRIVRICDGPRFDDDSMRRLDEIAEELDLQPWIERVTSNEGVGFYIEDGHVKERADVQESAAEAGGDVI